jgi:hypothetical protein
MPIVTEPPQHPPSSPEPPDPAVVEWGTERRGVLDRLAGWQHPRLSWALAGLGGVALLGSIIGEWQVIESPFGEEDPTESLTMGIGNTLVWGAFWLVGGLLLAVCGVVALAGQPSLRPYARTVGLAVALVELGILIAGTVNLSRESIFASPIDQQDLAVGRGVYAAFASVVLIGAALYLARTVEWRVPAVVAEPALGGEPEDLVVGPAEPLVHPAEDHPHR